MKLAELSVRRGVTFGVVFTVVLGFGLFSLSRLQLDLFPDISFPAVVVITSYTGAGPEDMETLVTRPVEGALAAVKGAESIESESKQGLSVVTVEFGWSSDMEQAETEVRRKLEQVEGLLPDDASSPLVFAMDPSLQPVVTFTVSGPYPPNQLRQLAEDEVAPRLERLDGVATADVAGGLRREIGVALDPERVAAYGLDLDTILGAIGRENLQEPGGSLTQGAQELTIQAEGRYQSVEELAEITVGMRQGVSGPTPLRLGDVARITDGFHESQRILEVDGQPAVLVTVRKQSGANTVQAAEAVLAELDAIRGDTTQSLQFQTVSNQADFINKSLSNLSSTALLGVGISFLVLLLFLRSFRSAALVAMAIPLSVIATFFVMDQAGMTLNIISMAGLALAVGMLVDNAIVVLENIVRLRDEGRSLKEAAIEGTAEVGTAVTASTLTTISVFVPILFVDGIAGMLFRDMAVTICFALIVSLAVAMSFVPLAASRLLKARKVGEALDRAETRDPLAGLRRHYARALEWCVQRRWVVALTVVALLVATGFGVARVRTDFMAQADQSLLQIQVTAPAGSSLEETRALAEEARAAIDEVVPTELRKLVAMDVGASEGMAAVFSGGASQASFTVPLVGVKEREQSQATLTSALQERLEQIPGLEVEAGSPMSALGGEGDLVVELRGHDLGAARVAAERLQSELRELPEVASVASSVQDQRPRLTVRFDRPKMRALGLSTAAAGRAISTAFKGRVAGRYSEDGEEHDILVRYGAEHRLDADELRRLPLVTSGGAVVPLGNVARVELGQSPTDISRSNQERVTKLTVTLHERYRDAEGSIRSKDLGAATERVEAVVASAELPRGLRPAISGSAEDLQESFLSLGVALIVAVLLVYLVMAAQFESLRQPFIILFTVPLASVGVVGIFNLTGTVVDVTALVGVIMLAGIVVNNGIVLVDAANRLREEGLDRAAAVVRAGTTRLRPVLLTSLTTILSMVPLALEIGEGAENWAGMAQAVIGGLVAATGLTLFVVPVVYTLLAPATVSAQEEAPATGSLEVKEVLA